MATRSSHHQQKVLELRQRRHNELQAELKHPIVFRVTRGVGVSGGRRVYLIPPWNYNIKGEYTEDGGLSDKDGGVNVPGGIRGYTTGYEDYYCNVGFQEMRVFALELLAFSVIAERWEEFFENPGKFLKEHWPNWTKAVQTPELKYQIEFRD